MILKFEVIFTPTKCGLKDKDGYFCRWGSKGARYHYDPSNPASKEAARKKADAQGAAAHAGGYEGSEKSIEEKKEDDRKKVPNPDEPGDEAEPGEESEEWKKSIDTPNSIEGIKEGSFILHKGKVGKILKVLDN